MKKNNQLMLFNPEEIPTEWEKEWNDMPDFVYEDKQPYHQIIVSFNNIDDLKKFSRLIGQKITHKTKSIWFPNPNNIKPSDYYYE